MLFDVICVNLKLWQMILPNSMVIAHILCQMLHQYVMADVEAILWQMLLPLFNSVVDVGTTSLLTIKSSVRLLWQVLLPLWQIVKPLVMY